MNDVTNCRITAYGRQLVAHMLECERILADVSLETRVFMCENFRLDLYPAEWVREMAAKLEAFRRGLLVREDDTPDGAIAWNVHTPHPHIRESTPFRLGWVAIVDGRIVHGGEDSASGCTDQHRPDPREP